MIQKRKTIETGPSRDGRDRFLWILFILAIIFRLMFVFFFRFSVSFDESHYLRLGGSLLERGIPGLLHPYWPPFYPGFIGLVHLLTRNLEFSGRLINILSGSFLVILVYRITREIFGRPEARLSAIFMAFFPPVAFGSTNAMPEALYSAIGIGGMVVGWKAFQKKNYWLGLMAGWLWGLSYLIKPEGMGFLFVYLFFGGIVVLWNLGKGGAWKRVVLLVVVLLGFLLLSAPYLVYLRQNMGKWTLSTKGEINQQMESAVYFNTGVIEDPFFHLTSDNRYLPYDMALHFGNVQELTKLQEGRERFVSIPLSNYIKKYVQNFYHILKYSIPHLFTSVLFVLWAVGFFGQYYDRSQWGFIVYLVCNIFFYWFLVVPMFHVNDRYLAPFLPLCLVWVGPGCKVCYRWMIGNMETLFSPRCRVYKWRSHLGRGLVLVGVLVFSFCPELARVVAVKKYDGNMWAEPVELKEAGLWLREHTDHPPVLMSLNKAVDFYAGQYDMRIGASFSYDPLARNLAYARFRGVEYLVFTNRYVDYFPNLSSLIEEADQSPELAMVYEKTYFTGIRAVIYRLVIGNAHRVEEM